MGQWPTGFVRVTAKQLAQAREAYFAISADKDVQFQRLTRPQFGQGRLRARL